MRNDVNVSINKWHNKTYTKEWVSTLKITNKYINWGAGPRASQYLVIGAKAHAIISGKYSPDIEDVKAVAVSILRHRIMKNYKAEAEGISIENIIEELLK